MLSRMVHHNLLTNPVPLTAGRRAVRRFGLGTLAYPVATIAGLIWPPLILIAIGALTSYYAIEQTQLLPDADGSVAISPEG
jgi:hypothetical protein